MPISCSEAPIVLHTGSRYAGQSNLTLEALRVAGLGQKGFGFLGIVGQAPIELFRPADALRPDQHAGRHGEAMERLDDAPDVDPLVERLAHAPVGEGIPPLDVRGPELGARLVEAEVERLTALGLLDFQARRGGDPLELVRRRGLEHVDLAREAGAGRPGPDRRLASARSDRCCAGAARDPTSWRCGPAPCARPARTPRA